MSRRSVVIASLAFSLIAWPADACTIFTLVKKGIVLVGNNEDWTNPNTRMWFVSATPKTLGIVYFGFDDLFPQGGMNEKGLFFDANALAPVQMPPSGRPSFQGNLIDHIMRTSGTVREALDVLAQYDTRPWLARAQFHFADRTGDAAVVESGGVFRRKNDFIISTNFRMSEVPDRNWPCERFRTAERMLSAADEATVEAAAAVLKATSGSITQYSNVYDLTHGIVHLYYVHNFVRSVRIDLAEELAKGARVVGIASLFRTP